MTVRLIRGNRIDGKAGDIVEVSPARAAFLIRYGLGATCNREREQTPEDANRKETPEDAEPKETPEDANRTETPEDAEPKETPEDQAKPETPEKRKNNAKNKKTTK